MKEIVTRFAQSLELFILVVLGPHYLIMFMLSKIMENFNKLKILIGKDHKKIRGKHFKYYIQ